MRASRGASVFSPYIRGWVGGSRTHHVKHLLSLSLSRSLFLDVRIVSARTHIHARKLLCIYAKQDIAKGRENCAYIKGLLVRFFTVCVSESALYALVLRRNSLGGCGNEFYDQDRAFCIRGRFTGNRSTDTALV